MKYVAKKQIQIVTLLIFTLCLFLALKPVHVNSSLTSLFPNFGEDQIPSSVQNRLSSQINVVVEADSFEKAKLNADKLYQGLLNNGISDVAYFIPNMQLENAKQFIKDHQYAFLTEDDRENIKKGNTRKISENSIKYISTTLLPPVVPLEYDPFSLVSKYMGNLMSKTSKWHVKDGVLWQYSNQAHYILINISIKSSRIDEANAFIDRILAVKNSIHGSAIFHLSGVPLHTYKTYKKCKYEITIISMISAVIALLLAFMLFRKQKLVFSVLLNLLVAFLSGTVALCVIFNEIHILSFAFGSSLIGICVDYSFHSMYNANNETRENLRRSLYTTVCCFIPLLFSNLPILRQVATFSLGGLIGTYIFIDFLSGHECSKIMPCIAKKTTLSKKSKVILTLLFSIFIIWDFRNISIQNDLTTFYNPDEQTKADDQLFYSISNFETSNIVLVKGKNIEEVLINEENLLKMCNDAIGISSFIPSIKRQKENYKLISRLYQDEATYIKNELGLKQKPTLNEQKLIFKDDFIESFGNSLFDKFTITDKDSMWSIVTTRHKLEQLPNNTYILSTQSALKSALKDFTENAFLSLLLGMILLSILMLYYYKRRAFLYLVPATLSVIGTLATINLLFNHISLFNILSLFIVVGLSIDYTIFHFDSTSYEAKRPVLFSFLSSVIGFGLLSFVSFNVVAAMGQTIAIGLIISYLTSLGLINNFSE